MRKTTFIFIIIYMVLFFLGCPVLTLEDLENPADPEAESYQGYLVVDNPSQIESHTQNGGRLSVPRFVVSKVVDAQSYQLQVANDEGFEDIAYDNTFTTNVLEPELPKYHLIRYWRARTKVDDSWAGWSSIQSFTYLHPQTVYFDSQGGNTPIIRHKEVMEGLLYGELPTAEHPAKAFDGWWGEPGGKGVQITAETPVATDEGHVVYAKWRGYLVNFNSQEGSAVALIEDVVHGTGILEPATPTRSGYEFDGWYTESACLNEWDFSSDVVVSDMSLYAKWNPASYTITFDRQGGSIPIPISKNVYYGQTYGNLPTVNRSGYVFGGWWTGINGTGDEVQSDTKVSIISDHTLYAKWNESSYKVIFNEQDGATPNPTSKIVIFNQPYGDLATTTREGYIFDGWWTGENGTGTQIYPTTKATFISDQTLYAKWNASAYTLSFDKQSGTNPNPVSKTIIYGQQYGNLATTTRDGYVFDGWWTGENGTGVQIFTTTKVTTTTDQTLYANWKIYQVGDIGPAGGYIFHDKGYYSNGWRYMEAAPEGWKNSSTDPGYVFGYNRTSSYGDNYVIGTGTSIGSGETNTENLVTNLGGAVYSEVNGPIFSTIYAAKACHEFSMTNGEKIYNDWFLPSKDELNLMYQYLKIDNLGGFSSDYYWSSSEKDEDFVWGQNFNNGSQAGSTRNYDDKVRPARAF